MTDTQTLIKAVRRGCTDRATRDVLLAALNAGTRGKLTRQGIMLYGPQGAYAAHFSVSDHRAAKNLATGLRRAGIEAA